MAIIQISKIQVRSGLSENLPTPLSQAEFGWALDTQRLYIGNGPISEGAPTVGNTEVLTQHSDILSLVDAYTYKGLASGYIAQTGTTALTPVRRKLQDILDEYVSVKAFGAKGDGVTDDTDAINRAYYQLFCIDNNPATRKVLFFPAGIYKVSNVIKIPTYSRSAGEGRDASVIFQTGSYVVARTADSWQQTGDSIGNNGALLPSNIYIQNMTFQNNTANHVFFIDSTVDAKFDYVGFKGNATVAPSSIGSSLAALTFTSTSTVHSMNLSFESCEFNGTNYGMVADHDMYSLFFFGCSFKNCYKAVKFGESVTGTGNAIEGPQGVTISGSIFDKISNAGIHVYHSSVFTSAHNSFLDVGNALTITPVSNTIIFNGNGQSSINDYFARTDESTYENISISNNALVHVVNKDGLKLGRHLQQHGLKVTATDNTAGGFLGVNFDSTTERAVKIYYVAVRDTDVRQGELYITDNQIDDVAYDNGNNIGLTFSSVIDSGLIKLKYTTTNTGHDVDVIYAVERLVY